MNKDTEHKGIRIPKELLEKINKSAAKEERTFSQQVIYILKKYYELQESEKWGGQKMSKQVKCKKCHLTYDSKKYECPYCHKKRFNPTGLIIFLLILVIAAGIVFYFFGDTIKEKLSGESDIKEVEVTAETEKTTVCETTAGTKKSTETTKDDTGTTTASTTENEDIKSGLVFNNLTIEQKEDTNEYIVKFDITNTTDNTISKKFTITNLADKVKANVIEHNTTIFNWSDGSETIDLKLVPEEIYKVEYTIQIENDWKLFEVYLSEITSNETDIKDVKIFTYENKQDITEITTDTKLNIITE